MPWKTYLFVGDSITEGYDDNGISVSCLGVPGRLLKDVLYNNISQNNYINFGQSGALVSDYCDRAEGYISADPSNISVVVASVYSPNVPSGQHASWAWDAQNLSAMRQRIIAFKNFCNSLGVLFIPVFWCASPFDLGTTTGPAALQAHIDALLIDFPYLIKAYEVIQDQSVTSGPYSSTVYCVDVTHPAGGGGGAASDTNGYGLLKDRFLLDIDSAEAAAMLHQGFVA